jgi:hypothetical protein
MVAIHRPLRTLVKVEQDPNSFGIRMKPKMENTEVDLNLIAEYKVPETPPWTLEKADSYI